MCGLVNTRACCVSIVCVYVGLSYCKECISCMKVAAYLIFNLLWILYLGGGGGGECLPPKVVQDVQEKLCGFTFGKKRSQEKEKGYSFPLLSCTL